MKNKAVILGTNYYIGLSVIRCLGMKGIHTVAMDYEQVNTYAAKSKYLTERHIMPHYRNEEEAALRYLIDYGRRQLTKPVLFPCADPYVEFIDRHLDVLRAYYLINMTEQGFWSSVMDKGNLHRLAVQHGVRVPETAYPGEPGFETNVLNEIGFPCIVKPADSAMFVKAFRVKMFKCHTFEELDEAIKKAKSAGLEVVVQRIVPGFDDHMYTFDAYVNQSGKVTHWMTCQKLRQFPINFGASTFTRQKHVPELFEIGAPFLEAIGYLGFGEVEFKKDASNGQFYLIEINVRTTTLNVLLNKCGINFPLLAYMELTGSEIGAKAVQQDTGIVFNYLYEDLLSARDYVRTKQLSRRQVLRSYFVRQAPAIWSMDDPAPAFHFLLMLIRKLKRRLIS
ncbi:carboxylate--amine ligase [Paenibacillus sp. R14(2021)]|uniref:carboxylate--amine ligase n=1 Tax=Paenibacillus sp. R14(2021) TaxID=2859228 RepID=UPI001C614842|nr:carboxylate--amine ligase [Paenibacillus sp. R14(2021)]